MKVKAKTELKYPKSKETNRYSQRKKLDLMCSNYTPMKKGLDIQIEGVVIAHCHKNYN